MLFIEIMKNGGPLMWIIFGCSLLAMFIFLEKWFQFHRDQVNVSELVRGLINVLRRNGYIEAISLCDNTPGPAARILTAAILAREQGEDLDEVKQAIMDANLVELPKLERHLNLLLTIGFISPLLGMLGTVLGIMRAFQTIHAKTDYLSAADLSGDIGMALVTMVGGLCLSIPCYVAYNYLTSRVVTMTQDMEKAASDIIHFFKHHGRGDKAEK